MSHKCLGWGLVSEAFARTLSNGMQADQKERLKEAWPIMRASQQLAAHERTVQTLRQAEDLRLAQRQTPVMKQ